MPRPAACVRARARARPNARHCARTRIRMLCTRVSGGEGEGEGKGEPGAQLLSGQQQLWASRAAERCNCGEWHMLMPPRRVRPRQGARGAGR